ncbi:hypothetical protein LOC67_04760 [Stieleria sp. JC731]|uniref:hypothetical protein n=1 Tax=Pirellulaceae TaxID=2691357 RepID=UPI001E32BA30|nr:hypothetical protein [Stieleria sp. JC731]MCC9599865.1 hypothetical protein [Stieleria sp. JC731]
MSRSKIKANLRAADRRRRRRLDEGSRSAPPVPASGKSEAVAPVDVAGLVIEAILSVSDSRTPLRDNLVISLLRSLAKQDAPSNPAVLSLYEKVTGFLDGRKIGGKAAAAAAKELLGIAPSHTSEDSPDGFVQYLELIAG